MLTMAVGQSDDVDPSRAIAEVIEQCRVQLDGRSPRAGILFCALDSFEPDHLGLIRAAFPGVDVMGSTSAGEMSSMGGLQEDSVELALFVTDEVEMGVGFGSGVDDDVAAACRTAVDEALGALTGEARICIVVSETLSAQLVSESLREALPAGVLVIGGGAGRPDLRGEEVTYQFCNERVATHGVAVLVLAGEVAFSTAVATGWKVLGPHGVVTASDYGVIREVEGRPAAEFVSGYFNVSSGATFGNPLAIHDAGSDDWYLRVVLGTDAEGGLRISGGVPVGATVQLTTTNPEAMLEATTGSIEHALQSFPVGSTPSAALVFSCAVRKVMLGTRSAQEVGAARAALPSIPIAGMYCIGEIAPAGASLDSHFLNETFVTLLLGE